jgi:hypothetical protein
MAGASVTMPHMNSRLFPLSLALIGIACVALALAIARHGITVSQYAL